MYYPKGKKQVLEFIDTFLTHQGEDPSTIETLRYQFRAGYCYYFAHMLQLAFHRGTVCVAYPYGHIVWVDYDGIPYDIEGVNTSEDAIYIPLSYFGEAYKAFSHIDDKFSCSGEYMEECKQRYLNDQYINQGGECDEYET